MEYELENGEKGLQAANLTGPDGAPVKGDPDAVYEPAASHSADGNVSDSKQRNKLPTFGDHFPIGTNCNTAHSPFSLPPVSKHHAFG